MKKHFGVAWACMILIAAMSPFDTLASSIQFNAQTTRTKVAGVPGSAILYKVQILNQSKQELILDLRTEIVGSTIQLPVKIIEQGQEKNELRIPGNTEKAIEVVVQTTEKTPVPSQGIVVVTFSPKTTPSLASKLMLYFYVVKEISMLLKIGANHVFVTDQDPFILDYPPYIKDGRTFVPLRFIAESFGATILWNNSERKVSYSLRGKVLNLWIDRKSYEVNGIKKTMDVAPEIKPPGRTFVPIRLVSEELGAKVEWKADQREIRISFSIDS
jgi:hypothetical protein